MNRNAEIGFAYVLVLIIGIIIMATCFFNDTGAGWFILLWTCFFSLVAWALQSNGDPNG